MSRDISKIDTAAPLVAIGFMVAACLFVLDLTGALPREGLTEQIAAWVPTAGLAVLLAAALLGAWRVGATVLERWSRQARPTVALPRHKIAQMQAALEAYEAAPSLNA